MSNKTKKAVAIKFFKDAGTTRRFEAGAVVDLTEGEYANYKAAGLVRDPTPEETKVKPAA